MREVEQRTTLWHLYVRSSPYLMLQSENVELAKYSAMSRGEGGLGAEGGGGSFREEDDMSSPSEAIDKGHCCRFLKI